MSYFLKLRCRQMILITVSLPFLLPQLLLLGKIPTNCPRHTPSPHKTLGGRDDDYVSLSKESWTSEEATIVWSDQYTWIVLHLQPAVHPGSAFHWPISFATGKYLTNKAYGRIESWPVGKWRIHPRRKSPGQILYSRIFMRPINLAEIFIGGLKTHTPAPPSLSIWPTLGHQLTPPRMRKHAQRHFFVLFQRVHELNQADSLESPTSNFQTGVQST